MKDSTNQAQSTDCQDLDKIDDTNCDLDSKMDQISLNSLPKKLLLNNAYLPSLHQVVKECNITILSALLLSGSNINQRDASGKTPLYLAAELGCAQVAEILVQRGAQINARDYVYSLSPLHCASRYGHIDIVLMLLGRNAIFDSQDRDCKTPLHYASFRGHKEIIQILLDKGANINARDKFFLTPLHYAVYSSKKDAVTILLHYGADVNAEDHKYQTPLSWAHSAAIIEVLAQTKDANMDFWD